MFSLNFAGTRVLHLFYSLRWFEIQLPNQLLELPWAELCPLSSSTGSPLHLPSICVVPTVSSLPFSRCLSTPLYTFRAVVRLKVIIQTLFPLGMVNTLFWPPKALNCNGVARTNAILVAYTVIMRCVFIGAWNFFLCCFYLFWLPYFSTAFFLRNLICKLQPFSLLLFLELLFAFIDISLACDNFAISSIFVYSKCTA